MPDIKAYLKSYIPARRYAERCLRDLDAETFLKSPQMDGMPRSSNPHGLDEQVARIEAIRKKTERARAKVLAMLEDIEDRIEALPDHDQRMVMKLRYIEGLSWEEVANEMSMSVRPVYYIHGKALAQMRKIPVQYLCDPAKNTECRKTSCFINGGPCHMTTKEECRA